MKYILQSDVEVPRTPHSEPVLGIIDADDRVPRQLVQVRHHALKPRLQVMRTSFANVVRKRAKAKVVQHWGVAHDEAHGELSPRPPQAPRRFVRLQVNRYDDCQDDSCEESHGAYSFGGHVAVKEVKQFC